MKLLDLQTGKYLELGKDWLYGGICRVKINMNFYLDDDNNQLKDHKGKSWKLLDEYAFTGVNKSEPQGMLKTLCDKTGAVIYGDRYAFLGNEECGNVFSFLWKSLVDWFFDFQNSEGNFSRIKKSFGEKFESRFLGNLFEEYSKQLRKEENKFEELMEKLN